MKSTNIEGKHELTQVNKNPQEDPLDDDDVVLKSEAFRNLLRATVEPDPTTSVDQTNRKNILNLIDTRFEQLQDENLFTVTKPALTKHQRSNKVHDGLAVMQVQKENIQKTKASLERERSLTGKKNKEGTRDPSPTKSL